MVKVTRIDKCLLCDREYISQGAEINNKLPTEYSLIYCYKCVNKAKKEVNVDIKTKTGRKFNFKSKESNAKIKSGLDKLNKCRP